MFDKDIIIVGGGPAGLTAGIHLCKAKYRVLLLEKEDIGGLLKKVECFHGHPDYPNGIAGPELAEKMIAEAQAQGLHMAYGKVEDIESFSTCNSVTCADGKNYTCSVVVMASGRAPKKLEIPGEEAFRGKGVIDCVLCDAALYSGSTVAVCGGGDAALIEALTMTRHADRVIIIEQGRELTALTKIQEKAQANPKIEFLHQSRVETIIGTKNVEAVKIRNQHSNAESDLLVDGVIVDIGVAPDTDYLDEIIELDAGDGSIPVNDSMETSTTNIFAVGDIRTHSAMDLRNAIKDGETAAQIIHNKMGSSLVLSGS